LASRSATFFPRHPYRSPSRWFLLQKTPSLLAAHRTEVEGEEGLLDQRAHAVWLDLRSRLMGDWAPRSARRLRSGASSLQPWTYCNVRRKFRTPPRLADRLIVIETYPTAPFRRHSDASVHMAGQMLKHRHLMAAPYWAVGSASPRPHHCCGCQDGRLTSPACAIPAVPMGSR
jgi:hypothetical protein